MKTARAVALIPLLALLAGCSTNPIFNPAGDVAKQQRDVLLIATGLMLLIVIPVMVATVVIAWRYRASNQKADYRPDWHHSTALEVGIWSIPMMLIVAIGALTWVSTHTLDPYRPIERLGPGRPLPANAQHLRVQAVALDWKWLFIYPDLGIATVNQLAAPIDTPIDFQITSSSMMNSLFIPALAGQVYAMPGMVTQLHAVANRTGDYIGFSGNYAGRGFSDMNFTFKSLKPADFQAWVAGVKAQGGMLDAASYLKLAQPSEREPARFWAAASPDLFYRISNECAEPGKMCISDMMRIDARGGQHQVGEATKAGQVANEHGRHEETVPNAPQLPPSRQQPVSPQSQPQPGQQTTRGKVAPGF